MQTREPLPAPSLAELSLFGDGRELAVLTDDALFEACGTRIAFTSRNGGVSAAPYASLNLSSGVGDDATSLARNRRIVLDALGVGDAATSLVVPKQVHGVEIVEVGEDVLEAQTTASSGADGVLCVRAGVPVQLCFADCTPVIVVAPGGAFAVLHAGWRGALAGIAGKGLAMLCAATGAEAAACNAYIGPHIGACCYETSAEILAQFVECYGAACDAGERRLDLTAAVVADLVASGADPARIVDARRCTSCNVDNYFSYRAEDGVTGRHGALAIRLAQEGGGR